MIKTIYLDNAATTKPKREVIDAINKCLVEDWGNPSSLYKFGIRAKDIVEKNRKIVADLIGANLNEIIFTSGACESNSHAICGYMNLHNSGLIISSIEHKSIMNIVDTYNDRTVIVPVGEDGFVDMSRLEEALATSPFETTLVSIQYANNEIGTIQNVEDISGVVHKYGGVLHTDATQIIPDRKINVNGIDMMSFSGQKLGATKGIGVLYVKNGIKINPIIYGSQEETRRGGTENVPYIAGLGEAIKHLAYPTSEHRDYFLNRILSEIENTYLVGCDDMDYRLKNNASICFKGVESESILLMLDQKDICVSSGSACNSTSLKPSYVLEAINIPKEDINSVVRFTFGEDTNDEEIDFVINELKKIITLLRKFK